MIPSVVIDVGNSRIKWGRCVNDRVVDLASLPADNAETWEQQATAWQIPAHSTWALAAVHPQNLSRVDNWLVQRGETVRVLRNWLDLGLRVSLANPERVGMDRLLNAVAARTYGPRPSIIIDAGTAITVDYLDELGCFRGGAILPGLRLMAGALHEHTAQLPLVGPPSEAPPLPGRSTIAAIEAGVYWSAAGGIRTIVAEMARVTSVAPRVFATGGDVPVLLTSFDCQVIHWPEMTLEGIRIAASR
jgi:type III pantothenate kinase